MTQHTLIAVPTVTSAFTGHSAYKIMTRQVVVYDYGMCELFRVKRSKLPADFGINMKRGAFDMADAVIVAKSK